MARFWLFMHLVGMAGFLAAHGVSMFAMFQLRAVGADRDRIFDLCDRSKRSVGPMYVSTGLLLLGGVAGGIVGKWFGDAWLWVSILVLLATMAAMSSIATPYMKKLRDGCTRWHDGSYTLSDEDLRAALDGPIISITAAVGTLGLLLILYLMVYKPGA
jgi:cytochrome bd-type quinol oxidase subunit 2